MGDLTTDPMGVRSPPEVATPGVNPNPIMEVMVTTEVHHPLQANRGITRCQQRLHPRHPEPEVAVSILCSILSANILIRQCSSIPICDHLTVSFLTFLTYQLQVIFFSEALILALVNPLYSLTDCSCTYDFSTRKIKVQNILCAKIVFFCFVFTFKTIFVHNLF